jgi:Tfp pilus assembly protein PilF
MATASTNYATPVASSSATLMIKRGYAQLQENNLGLAAKSFSQALQSDGDNVTARRYLAYTLIKQSSPVEALNQLNQVEDPSAFDLYLKGLASDMMLHPNQAAYCYKAAVEKDPQNNEYRLKAIHALINISKYEEASVLSSDGRARALTPAQRKFYADELARTENLAAAIAKNRPCSR